MFVGKDIKKKETQMGSYTRFSPLDGTPKSADFQLTAFQVERPFWCFAANWLMFQLNMFHLTKNYYNNFQKSRFISTSDNLMTKVPQNHILSHLIPNTIKLLTKSNIYNFASSTLNFFKSDIYLEITINYTSRRVNRGDLNWWYRKFQKTFQNH